MEDVDDLEELWQRREMELLYLAVNQTRRLGQDSQRHLKEGFARRIQIMQLNRGRIFEIAEPSRRKSLAVYETIEINTHLNSYYVQLRGALDNLAWALQYEFHVLGAHDEDSKIKGRCYLFSNRFLSALEERLPLLARKLKSKSAWADELKDLRDPVAHRIPLYVAPGTISSDRDRTRVEALYREADELINSGDLTAGLALIRKGHSVGEFIPLLISSGPKGLEVRHLHNLIRRDHDEFADVAESVMDALDLRV